MTSATGAGIPAPGPAHAKVGTQSIANVQSVKRIVFLK
jgi:hypothetical protein